MARVLCNLLLCLAALNGALPSDFCILTLGAMVRGHACCCDCSSEKVTATQSTLSVPFGNEGPCCTYFEHNACCAPTPAAGAGTAAAVALLIPQDAVPCTPLAPVDFALFELSPLPPDRLAAVESPPLFLTYQSLRI